MRVIGEIPHEHMKITIFYMNQKYLLKFENNGLEQTYKISEFDYLIRSVEDIIKVVTPEFIHRVLALFAEMHNCLSEGLKDYC
jgi:hypothetical protein